MRNLYAYQVDVNRTNNKYDLCLHSALHVGKPSKYASNPWNKFKKKAWIKKKQALD